MLDTLRRWYDDQMETKRRSRERDRNMIAAGLIIVGMLRDQFPIRLEDIETEGGGQVRGLSGKAVGRILSKHGESRFLGTEIGRTSRGTLRSAQELASQLNEHVDFSVLPPTTREEVVQAMEAWLAEKATAYLDQRRIEFDLNLARPLSRTFEAILAAAAKRKVAGIVAQHLVGAKLQLRYPDVVIPNHKATTADLATGRLGDFQLGDTVFHVTMTPMDALVPKLHGVRREGLRSVLLVPRKRVHVGETFLEDNGLDDAVELLVLEAFLAQNVGEVARFDTGGLAEQLRMLIGIYNRRVQEAEGQQGLMLDVPAVLVRRNGEEEAEG